MVNFQIFFLTFAACAAIVAIVDTELTKKAVGAIEELMQSEIGSGRPDRFANVQHLAQQAQAIDRMAASLRVSEFENGQQQMEGGIRIGVPQIMGGRMFPGDVGDNQRQMIMAMMPALGELRDALLDMREKDRSVKRANLSAETLDLIRLKNELPDDSAHRADISARIDANFVTLAELPKPKNEPVAISPVASVAVPAQVGLRVAGE